MALTRSEQLSAFLARFEEKPVEWGKDDCSAIFALWLAELGIRVPVPSYSSREGAQAVIAGHGGLVEACDASFAGAGLWERVGFPHIGDIGVIQTRKFGPVGVICAQGGICAWRKEEGGFYWLTPRRYLKVWAVE